MVELIRREFVVEVPLEQAWANLIQVTTWTRWALHIRSIEVEPVGAIGMGSKGVIRLKNGIRSRFTVVEFNPYSNWKWVGPFLSLSVHYDHRFERMWRTGTKLTWVVAAEGRGARILGRLFAAVYARAMEKAILRLSAELSAGHA